uniref:Uncharacterized protein n=1 Tax=Arundo donax TaxID=35708 RepID=A0A0A9F7P5_ARUDO
MEPRSSPTWLPLRSPNWTSMSVSNSMAPASVRGETPM